jgi:hypothetical protein
MARPWIEFLFAQKLPWTKGLYGGGRDDVEVKTLSMDDSAGDSSLLLKYPAGWQRSDPEAFNAEEEFFILDGEIEINGQVYTRDCYGCFPAGYVRSNAQSKTGCVALTFFDAEPTSARTLDNAYGQEDLVAFINTLDMKWDASTADPTLEWMGNRRKVLKWDRTYDQKGTFLFATSPQIYPENWACPELTHPCVEETFMLSGEFIGPYGRMSKGAYFWRPEEKPHGPFGTREGAFALIRFKYGKHINVWGDRDVAYSFDFPFKPELPANLARLHETPYDGAELY